MKIHICFYPEVQKDLLPSGSVRKDLKQGHRNANCVFDKLARGLFLTRDRVTIQTNYWPNTGQQNFCEGLV